ncbi:hypothetical protein [Nocardia yunnanensis]|nr:hypothetical protein [Nocardia yunnanensis]
MSDGGANLQLLWVAGMTTVLVTRLYLAATGYPKVGNGTLHIAHALWGGLLMLAGLIVSLTFTGTVCLRVTALSGGIGLGLFIDEVGKFITQSNDYFFRPAAAVIYVLFAILVVITATARTPRTMSAGARLSAAAAIAATGPAEGLTPAQRTAILELLDGDDGEAAHAVRRFAELSPTRLGRNAFRTRAQRLLTAARHLVTQPLFVSVVVALFVVSRIAIDVVFISQAVPLLAGGSADPGHDGGAIIAAAVTRTVEAVFTVTGAVCWRRRRQTAIRLLKAALFVNLCFTQLFNFTDSQFVAITELPFLILVLLVLSSATRGQPVGAERLQQGRNE